MDDNAAVRSQRRFLYLRRGRARAAATLLLALAWPTSSISGIDSRSSSAVAPPVVSRNACGAALPRPDSNAACRASEHDPVRLAQYMSNVCYTPYGWCYLPQFGPIGAPCWCPSPYGPVGGYVR